jgi:thiol-disulfide isomerase/thioredoxin
MDRHQSVVTAERFARGMTFDEYVRFVATPQNLAREGSMGNPRRDMRAQLRATFDATRLEPAQAEALRWLAAQPGGPAKMLVLSEEWSSDCRRDVPVFARMAEAAPFELRIFPRDGQKFGSSARPSLAEAPDSNADIMAEFLNDKNGRTWQSIPVAVFYTRDMQYLYHYVEYPAIYHKDSVVGRIRAARPGESAEQTRERSDREFTALQRSPFFTVWASAGVDEIISALHERLVLGAPGKA